MREAASRTASPFFIPLAFEISSIANFRTLWTSLTFLAGFRVSGSCEHPKSEVVYGCCPPSESSWFCTTPPRDRLAFVFWASADCCSCDANMLFSVNILKRHSFSLNPPDAQEAFFWTIEHPGEASVSTRISNWTAEVGAACRMCSLTAPCCFYYLTGTRFPDVLRERVRFRRAAGR